MVATFRKPFLLLSGGLIIAIPLIVSFIYRGGLPPGFGVFPPQPVEPDPPFSLPIFLFGAGVALVILALIIFPQWFGFKQIDTPAPKLGDKQGFPAWFWPGVVIWVLNWIVMWGQFAWLGPLVYFTFVPMWWGFILALDGVVYYRTGGISLLSTRPRSVVMIGLSSCVGWYLFEYLDYFVLSNWYYPDNTLLSQVGYLVWFGLAYTTVIPSVFEWYNLLNTFDFWRKRYANGPKVKLSATGWWIVFGLGQLLIAALTYLPYPFFYAVWLGPLLVLTGALMVAGYWTPFSPLAKGNWSLVGLMALACVFNYLLGEMWNFWSPPSNPNYWKYAVPYVNIFHIFEMPVLGYFGYLPFGVLCWIWWLLTAYLLNLNPEIDLIE
jgi:hypothetical protein